MPSVNLSEEEWQKIMNVLMTQATWIVANPLLQKMTEQLARQVRGNSGEVPVPQPHLEQKPTH